MSFWEALRESRRRRLHRKLDAARERHAEAEGRLRVAAISVRNELDKARIIKLSGQAARYQQRVVNLESELQRELSA